MSLPTYIKKYLAIFIIRFLGVLHNIKVVLKLIYLVNLLFSRTTEGNVVNVSSHFIQF